MAGGLLRPVGSPESGLIGSLLYPLRGAEAVAIAVVMGSILWGFTILLPEYCLAIWADANSLGTPSMGMLVVLISAIPAILLLPLFLIYLLQYLGRVLVSSARGDLVPPRMPDRNFDGFFHGLSPWVIWLVLGVSVGLLPFTLLIALGDRSLSDRPIAAVSLLILGAAYALVALMLSFLHDRPLACAPPGVLSALLHHGGTLMPALLKASALLGLGAVSFVLLRSLRTSQYWIYLISALGWWVLSVWLAIVVMRLLGVHYVRNQATLKWHGKDPRWGIRWRL